MELPLVMIVVTVPMSLGFFDGQAKFLASEGFRVVAVASPGPELDDFGRAEGIEVLSVDMARSFDLVADLRALVKLVRLMRARRPSIVWAHTPKAGLLATVAGWIGRSPQRIYHVHGLPAETAVGGRRACLIVADVVAALLAGEVWCVSPSLASRVVEMRIASPRKVRVLGMGSINGVDVDRFSPARVGSLRVPTRARFGLDRSDFVIGFVGRLARDKGIAELVDAHIGLRAIGVPSHLLLVGTLDTRDPLDEDVRERLEVLPAVHRVEWTRSVEECYAVMDVLCLPSHREGFGSVLLEASACGLPVVATSVTGCIDAVCDELTGRLVNVGNVREIVSALQEYWLSPALRREHGKRGREWVLANYERSIVWNAASEQLHRLSSELD